MPSSPLAHSIRPAASRWWQICWKGAVSLWLAYHLLAITVGPASIPPTTPIFPWSWPAFGPYLQWTYMNHGYHFFAPDPGPSTLIRYSGVRADGTAFSGQIPDLQQHVPRLLYHRHFMLTETLASMDNADPRLQALLVTALARQLAREQQAESISLTRVTHLIPTMERLRAGEGLDHPDLFEEQPLGRFEWADF
jgi:hypothetical protein